MSAVHRRPILLCQVQNSIGRTGEGTGGQNLKYESVRNGIVLKLVFFGRDLVFGFVHFYHYLLVKSVIVTCTASVNLRSNVSRHLLKREAALT